MASSAKPAPAALGFRVKSGWAMAVLLTGPSSAPRLVKCKAILLSDPKIPQSKQPYHAALELPEAEGREIAKKLGRVVARAASKSVKDLLKQSDADGFRVMGGGLVAGSLVDPATLHNEHIRAHGLEGQLFRAALEDALRERKIPYQVFVEKDAFATASALLQVSLEKAKSVITGLGESQDGAWRAEEKLAALAAWVALRR